MKRLTLLDGEVRRSAMDRAELKRRLSAVLIADVVGYSRLMSADEEGTNRLAGVPER